MTTLKKCTRDDCRFINPGGRTCQFEQIIITKEGCYNYEQNFFFFGKAAVEKRMADICDLAKATPPTKEEVNKPDPTSHFIRRMKIAEEKKKEEVMLGDIAKACAECLVTDEAMFRDIINVLMEKVMGTVEEDLNKRGPISHLISRMRTL